MKKENKMKDKSIINVFKGTKNTVDKEAYNKAWVKLISSGSKTK